MRPPRLVIFDMDDVLCRYDLGRRLRALSAVSGKSPRDIRAAIWDSGFEDESDSGRYPEGETYLAEFANRLGHPLSLPQWIAARRISMTPDAAVLTFAARCAGIGKIALFTNNGPLLKENLPEIFPEATMLFGRECYCSYEFRSKKPDPEVYRRLLERLETQPEDSWFIDDKKSNVEGARLAGMEAHLFVNHTALARRAAELGL